MGAQISPAYRRCPPLDMVQALEAIRAEFDTHVITQWLPPRSLRIGKVGDQGNASQRTSSAAAGRNGYLSHMNHNHRRLPRRRYKILPTYRA